MRRILALVLLAFAVSPAFAEDAATHLKSKQVRIQRKNGAKVQTWTGDVRYARGNRSARADKLVHDESRGISEALGRVRGALRLNDGARIEAAGHRAHHNNATGLGKMSGKKGSPLLFKRIGPNGEALGKGSGKTLAWNAKKETAQLRGTVRFDDTRGSLRADEALFSHTLRRVRLTGGRPVLTTLERTWSGAVQAETIDVYEGDAAHRKVVGEGRAEGWLHFPGKNELLSR